MPPNFQSSSGCISDDGAGDRGDDHYPDRQVAKRGKSGGSDKNGLTRERDTEAFDSDKNKHNSVPVRLDEPNYRFMHRVFSNRSSEAIAALIAKSLVLC